MSEFNGEWWLIDGVAHFADGDIGDMNHNAYVLQYLGCSLIDALADACQGYPELKRIVLMLVSEDGHLDRVALRCAMNDWADRAQRDGRLTVEEADDIHGWLRARIDWDPVRYRMLMSDDTELPKDYAIENLGWVRVVGTNVEAWRLDRPTLRKIADGLYDAYGEVAELGYYLLESMGQPRRRFDGVPFRVIADGNMRDLHNWKNEAHCR